MVLIKGAGACGMVRLVIDASFKLQVNKSRAIGKLLSAKGLAIKFSTIQLEALYDATKSS